MEGLQSGDSRIERWVRAESRGTSRQYWTGGKDDFYSHISLRNTRIMSRLNTTQCKSILLQTKLAHKQKYSEYSSWYQQITLQICYRYNLLFLVMLLENFLLILFATSNLLLNLLLRTLLSCLVKITYCCPHSPSEIFWGHSLYSTDEHSGSEERESPSEEIKSPSPGTRRGWQLLILKWMNYQMMLLDLTIEL